MKKFRINILLLLHHTVYLTAIQNFLSAVNFSNIINQLTDLFFDAIGYSSCIVVKNKIQSFQLPK